MPTAFSLTYDYRCPFARIAHDHVVTGLRDGADWDVTFVPLSLGQFHVEHGEPDVWDDPDRDRGLLALQVSVAVRDTRPDRFVDLHHALFEARHAEGFRLADEPDLRKVLDAVGLDADEVFDSVASGAPLATVRREHEAAVDRFGLWGVPTFCVGDAAVFVRLMERPTDASDARRTIERLLDTITGWPQLNEFKHTRVPR